MNIKWLRKNNVRHGVVVFLTATLVGCGTVQGPVVSRQEINEETKLLEVKAFQHDMEQMKKINEISLKVMAQIPEEDVKVSSAPFIGLYVLPVHRITNRMFDQRPSEGVYIGNVIEGTPVAKAGLRSGDVLAGINEEKIKNINTIVTMMKKAMHHDELKAGDTLTLHIVRGQENMALPVEISELPVDIQFFVINDDSVNAWAVNNKIFVTAGMLNFVDSDNELAAVLAHEISHISRGHLKRKATGIIMNTIVSVSLGVTAELFVPGLGDVIQSGSQAAGGMVGLRFSRDLEREADYFGMKYYAAAGFDPAVMVNFHERFAIELPKTLVTSYLNSHPTSAERKIRLQKSAEEFQAGK